MKKSKYVKLKLDKTNTPYTYHVVDQNSEILWSLVSFLEDIKIDYDYFVDWLQQQSLNTSVGGNVYGLENVNGQIFIFCSLESFDPILDPSAYFSTSRENMLNILHDWTALVSKKPNIILITQEEGEEKVTFTTDKEIN